MTDKSYQIQIDSNELVEVAVISSIGDRADQQDSFGILLKETEGMVVVCDGMGGYNNGAKASKTAVNCCLKKYDEMYPIDDYITFLTECTNMSNELICNIKDESGKNIVSGSTLVSLAVTKEGAFWNSVGDSRLYFVRNEEIIQITQDQNYSTVLKEQLKAGVIDEKEYEKESKKGEALISYLGMKKSPLIDYNETPLILQHDDKFIIASDGLYKVLDENQILNIITNFININDSAQAFELKAQNCSKEKSIRRDNMTIALIRIK